MKRAAPTSILVAVTLLAVAIAAQAQQPKKIHPIGYLTPLSTSAEFTRSEGIRLALRERGYLEGQNIAIEYDMGRGSPIGSPSLLPSWCDSRLMSS